MLKRKTLSKFESIRNVILFSFHFVFIVSRIFVPFRFRDTEISFRSILFLDFVIFFSFRFVSFHKPCL
jgi:hypothetical protein